MNLVDVCSIGRKTLGSHLGFGQDETSRQVTKVRSKKQSKVITQNVAPQMNAKGLRAETV